MAVCSILQRLQPSILLVDEALALTCPMVFAVSTRVIFPCAYIVFAVLLHGVVYKKIKA